MEHVLKNRRAVDEKMKKHGPHTPRPAVGPPPPCHPAFARARLLLFDPLVINLQSTILANLAKPLKTSSVLLVRCLHLLTLQLHACSSLFSTTIQPCPSVNQFLSGLIRNPMLNHISEPTAGDVSGPGILGTLLDITEGKYGRLSIGDIYEEGLLWCIEEIVRQAGPLMVLQGVLRQRIWDLEERWRKGQDACCQATMSRKQQASRAQKRAMKYLQEQQKAFWEGQMDVEGGEEGTRGGVGDGRENGEPVCLYCHERTGAMMGWVGYVQRSNVLGNALVREWAGTGVGALARVCRDCQMREGWDKKSKETRVLKQGIVVIVRERRGKRLRVRSTRGEGWITEMTREGLRLVETLETHCWQHWGKTRLHLSLCGHAGQSVIYLFDGHIKLIGSALHESRRSMPDVILFVQSGTSSDPNHVRRLSKTTYDLLMFPFILPTFSVPLLPPPFTSLF